MDLASLGQCNVADSATATLMRVSSVKRKRAVAKKACCLCRASKLACSDVRPCPRCIRLGQACETASGVGRGPKARTLESLKYVKENELSPTAITKAITSPRLSLPESTTLFMDALPLIPGNPYSADLVQVHRAVFGNIYDGSQCSLPIPLLSPHRPDPRISLLYLMYECSRYVSVRSEEASGIDGVMYHLTGLRNTAARLIFQTSNVPLKWAAKPLPPVTGRGVITPSPRVGSALTRAAVEELPFPCLAYVAPDFSHVKVIVANTAAAEMFGYPREELERLFFQRRFAFWLELLPVNEWRAIMPYLVRGIAEHQHVFRFSSHIIRRDGRMVWTYTIIRYSYLPNGFPDEIVFLFVPDGEQSAEYAAAQLGLDEERGKRNACNPM